MAQVEFVKCRTLGHAWFDVPDDARWNSRRVWRYRLVLRCERCGMQRYDCIDAFGNVGQRHYDAPEGYSYARDETPTRSEFRLMMLKPPPRRKARARTASPTRSPSKRRVSR